MASDPLAIQRPLLNGHEYSFASLEVMVNNIVVVGLKSISYAPKKDVGKVYGTLPQKIGRTRGKEDPTCELDLYSIEWEVIRQSLGDNGQGYMEKPCNIMVTRQEPGRPVIQDYLVSCQVTNVANSGSDGTDALVVKVTFDVMRILTNKQAPSFPLKIGF